MFSKRLKVNSSIFLQKKALILRDFFAENSTNIISQPPYSSDLAPCNYWLFSKKKRPLRRHRFESIEEIQEKAKMTLKSIPSDEYKKCFEDWKIRWYKCLLSEGDYFEGDEIDLEQQIKIFIL